MKAWIEVVLIGAMLSLLLRRDGMSVRFGLRMPSAGCSLWVEIRCTPYRLRRIAPQLPRRAAFACRT
jgi:hypothetical protein